MNFGGIMDFFIDMCIIIFYSDITSKEYEGVLKLINKRGGDKIILCYYISNENLPKWINRQKIILREVIRKMNRSDYEIGSSDEAKLFLFRNDIFRAKKLFMLSLSNKKENFYKLLIENQTIMFQRISFFLRKIIDKKVIPIDAIESELKSAIFGILNNHSDSMTLASGIQYHNQEEKVTFLTGDKKDWTKENLELALPEFSSLRKKYPNLPEIKYI
jgi:hypothetical protein